VSQPPVIEIPEDPDASNTPDPVVEFLFFFQHLASLDAAADSAEAEGNPNASQWRRHEQLAAGLTDEQGEILKEVAYGCNQALQDHDAELQASGTIPADQSVGTREIVSAAVDELRSRLGEEAFQTLASYVHATFGPEIELVSSSPGPGSPVSLPPVSDDPTLPVEVTATTQWEIFVNSHITKLSGNQYQALCTTRIVDAETAQKYPYTAVLCTVYGDDGSVTDVPCDPSNPGICQIIFGGFPGTSYHTEGGHDLGLNTGTCAGVPGKLLDPLHYCRPSGTPFPVYGISASIHPLGDSVCWEQNGFGACGLAQTVGRLITFLDITPYDVTLYPNQQQRFTPRIPVALRLVGPGTLDGTGLYKAPATIASPQTATIQACDVDDCFTSTIHLKPYEVTLTPAIGEVLPQGGLNFTATIPSTPGRQVEWSLSAATGLATGTITPATDDPLKGVYKAPRNDEISSTEEITVKVCGKADAASPSVCATALVTVPKMLFFISAQKTTLIPGETLQLTAFVQGSSQTRKIDWSRTPATDDSFPTVSEDTLLATYKAPFFSNTGAVDVKACFKDSPAFCSDPLHLVISEPHITGVTGQWHAGKTTQFTITGTGFGAHPVVKFTSLPTPSVSSVTDTLITGQVVIPVSMGGKTTQASVKVLQSNGDEAESLWPSFPIAAASLGVLPATAQLHAGESLTFAPTCRTASSEVCTTPENISWNASLGSFVGSRYTAPPSVATSTVATINACWSAGVCAIAQVTLLPAVTLTVTVSPKTATVTVGQAQQFTAQVTGSANTAVTWSLQPSTPDAGSINPTSGLYSAPAALGGVTTVTVIATSQADGTKKDTATVTLTAPLTVTSTPSPAAAYYGLPITWTASASGGTPATTQYALVRQLTGTTTWLPASLAWQASNVLTWTPGPTDVGIWKFFIMVKDGNTPAVPGYAGSYNPGNVQVVAPPTLTSTPSPAVASYGYPITWTATSTGGTQTATQFAFFRRRSGTTTWTPIVGSPSWQASNVYNWTPSSADAGTWDIYIWVRDSATPANMNTFGYAAGYNPGSVQVVGPLTSLTCTPSPASATSGSPITWTATANGGVPATTQYALFRRLAGATAWTPLVSSPAWQSSNVLSWTPISTDAGTWEISIWAKDGNTPPGMNTYGFAAYCNPGPVQVVAPLGLTGTASPAAAYYGIAIKWTATASGGIPASTEYAIGRRRVGEAAWIPTVLVWQTSNVLSWTPTSADVGTWEIGIVVRDGNTPPNANTYGYSAYYNPGNVQVVAPLTLTSTPSPAWVNSGTAVTWTATAGGGTQVATQFAFFRRRSGTTTWSPSVSSPNWQPSNVSTWTPTAAEAGTWDTYVWVKDSATPASMNVYGYAAGFNTGPVQVVAPLTLTCTPSPSPVYYGNPITWAASGGGGNPATFQYALFRRRAGTTTWTPSVTTPAWQPSNAFGWTPTSADAGNWEITVWLKDGNTPATMNTYGYAITCNPGTVQVLAPPSLSGTVNPSSAIYGNPITWTASASGGYSGGRQYAFFRRPSGTATWIPSVSSPNWQSSNVYSWTPTSGDVGTWDTYIWVRDGITPSTMNTYGYSAGFNTGPVQIVAPPPITLGGSTSPASSPYGTAITWTANASGGTPSTLRYALFRRRAGTTPWTPDVTAPAWQSSNVLRWTPTSADAGTWEIFIWAKDGNTPADMNTYGFAAYYNAGTVQVVAPPPLTLSGTGSPASSPYGTAITWTANAGGGTPSSIQYALFRRRTGTTPWTPDVTTPAWQTSNVLRWTPTSADVGTWEIFIWVRDGNTPPDMNTYGLAAYYNAGLVQVVAP